MCPKNWLFRPTLLPTVAMVITLVLMLYLGNWQLQRADEKQALHDLYQISASLEPIGMDMVIEMGLAKNDLLWRNLVLTGQYAGFVVYLLDNQIQNGVPGYHVFSPFRIQGVDKWVLVNRGWVAASVYRDQLPELSTPREVITIQAQVYPIQQPIILDNTIEEEFAQGVKRVQQIKLESIGQLLGYNFVPYVTRLAPSSLSGYSLSWQDPGSGKERHLGYAFQWFAMALVLVIIYFSINIKTHKDEDE